MNVPFSFTDRGSVKAPPNSLVPELLCSAATMRAVKPFLDLASNSTPFIINRLQISKGRNHKNANFWKFSHSQICSFCIQYNWLEKNMLLWRKSHMMTKNYASFIYTSNCIPGNCEFCDSICHLQQASQLVSQFNQMYLLFFSGPWSRLQPPPGLMLKDF